MIRGALIGAAATCAGRSRFEQGRRRPGVSWIGRIKELFALVGFRDFCVVGSSGNGDELQLGHVGAAAAILSARAPLVFSEFTFLVAVLSHDPTASAGEERWITHERLRLLATQIEPFVEAPEFEFAATPCVGFGAKRAAAHSTQRHPVRTGAHFRETLEWWQGVAKGKFLRFRVP
jgi:hypothetical protein